VVHLTRFPEQLLRVVPVRLVNEHMTFDHVEDRIRQLVMGRSTLTEGRVMFSDTLQQSKAIMEAV
jgi:hypothetical protein